VESKQSKITFFVWFFYVVFCSYWANEMCCFECMAMLAVWFLFCSVYEWVNGFIFCTRTYKNDSGVFQYADEYPFKNGFIWFGWFALATNLWKIYQRIWKTLRLELSLHFLSSVFCCFFWWDMPGVYVWVQALLPFSDCFIHRMSMLSR